MNVLVFIEAFSTIVSLFSTHASFMEIMAAFEHMDGLSIPFADEFHVALVTFELFGDNALNPISIKLHNISHDVFFKNINCIIQNILMISFSLNFFFKRGSEFLISIGLVDFFEEDYNSVKVYIFGHSHHECLDSD